MPSERIWAFEGSEKEMACRSHAEFPAYSTSLPDPATGGSRSSSFVFRALPACTVFLRQRRSLGRLESHRWRPFDKAEGPTESDLPDSNLQYPATARFR